MAAAWEGLGPAVTPFPVAVAFHGQNHLPSRCDGLLAPHWDPGTHSGQAIAGLRLPAIL